MKNINFPLLFLLIYFITFLFQESTSNNDLADNYYGEYKSHNYFNFLDDLGKEILLKVDESENIIFIPKENTPFCKANPGYAAYVGWPNYNGTDFGICTNRIINGLNFNEASLYINEVVSHEGMHVAQFCKRPGFNNPALHPLGLTNLDNLLSYEENVNSDIYKGIPRNQYLAELEAYYAEDKPNLISNLITRYCYKKKL